MNLRLAVMDLSTRYKLSRHDAERLRKLAGIGQQPHQLMRYAPAGLAVLAAVLGGIGIIFWIAANWEGMTRTSRFALMEGFFAVMCAGALMRPAARVPLSVVALLATGALLAFFGQTYQTGADPWQLFAWWSALTLPLCFGVRHDALWTAWSIVTMTALHLWSRASGGYQWTAGLPLPLHQLLHWLAALVPAVTLSSKFNKYTGAGIWPLRICIFLATLVVGDDTLTSVFSAHAGGEYYLGTALLAVMAAAFARSAMFDLFALCVLALGLNVLIDAGIAVALTTDRSWGLSVLLVMGLAAAGLMGGTVKAILAISRSGGVKWSIQ
ncbi:MAG: hypothetical protein JWQ01_479 [Massilia sp.]|nr:hypothetical protein [Massilia sp.]